MSRLQGGDAFADRYRLERLLGSSDTCETWVATDQRLDRSVALRVFVAELDHEALSHRCGMAASLTHPRVVRIFDTGVADGRFYAVSELMQGSLADASAPVSAAEALQLASDITEALHHAHERGVAHGHLHESNVLIAEGRAKVADFALGDLDAEEAPTDRDLAAAGSLLRRMMGATDRPVPDSPKGLGPVVEGLADGAYTSAATAFDDLSRIAKPPAARARRRSPRGRLVLLAIALLGLAAFGLSRLGAQTEQTRLIPGGVIDDTSLRIAAVDDFDPPPGDGREGADTVANLADGDPTTYWSTERYRTERFSGIKSGVGVVIDLGEPTTVGRALVLFPAQGCGFELRHAGDPEASIGSWTVAATVGDAPKSAAISFGRSTARYWLLWITSLTPDAPGTRGSFACAVSEADLFAP